MSANAFCAFMRDTPEIFNYKCYEDSDCPTEIMPRVCFNSCKTGWRYESKQMPGEYFEVGHDVETSTTDL